MAKRVREVASIDEVGGIIEVKDTPVKTVRKFSFEEGYLSYGNSVSLFKMKDGLERATLLEELNKLIK
jgi:hypothetical protein